MKYIEELDWILDKEPGKINNEEEYKQNIDFVHSLGLKCDCVGWSILNLYDPRVNEILSAIKTFCNSGGWNARGIYSRKYTDYESDWYELTPISLGYDTIVDNVNYVSEQGTTINMYNIRAYKETTPDPKCWGERILVPERFRNACINHNIQDVSFCWAKDEGKYAAEQYFYLYCDRQIPSIAVVKNFNIKNGEQISALGGSLPCISDVFYKLQQSIFQDCYLEDDMPDSYIAYAYSPSTFSYCGKNKFLIHKTFAEILLSEKAISPSALHPAMIVKDVPDGYTLEKTEKQERPIVAHLNQSITEYENLKNKSRPVRKATEKEALKLLRTIKKERNTEFKKAMPKKICEAVAATQYSSIIPYYSVANGGFLSDEYEFLAYNIAYDNNKKFIEEIQAEELLQSIPLGMVFAQCPNGDRILLCENGNVIRISHEELATIFEWPSLAQFFIDALNE